MYFKAGGHYYVPYLSADGAEMYVMVDAPPTPSSTTAAAAPPVQPSHQRRKLGVGKHDARGTSRALSVRWCERLEVPAGTVLVVRLAAEVSSATAQVGNRFQGFLDQDVAANGRMMAPRGTKVLRRGERGRFRQQDEGPADDRA